MNSTFSLNHNRHEPGLNSLKDFASSIAKAQQIFGASLVGVVIFGSYARGELRESSDIDLMLILKTGTKYMREHMHEWDASNLTVRNHVVSATLLYLVDEEIPQNALWFEAAVDDGIVLLDTDGLIAAHLERIRNLIASGKVIQKKSHGQRYWCPRSENG